MQNLFDAPLQRSNIPELSVSELSFALKKTLEDGFARVRVRGELSGLKLAASGHLYADLKDADAVMNVICWRGTMSRLQIRPADGMEVVCTGKITTYPKSSRYQLIIESMELAGQGALLKMLEDRKKMLAAEGLFAAERKKPLPFLPERIGVITSPTGAVIRDILHRLNDRFPRHVLVWPVAVQGVGAAEQITAAINGFDRMGENRPDVIIVARGGGSLEDLMAFNEENVVRAAASCSIPLISAVGHETDTTLIDHAADLRAPTPTAAAEMAVPVRRDLWIQMMESFRRLYGNTTRNLQALQQRIDTSTAGLGDPQRLLDIKAQSLDHATHRLTAGFDRQLSRREARLGELGGMLRHPRQILQESGRMLEIWDHCLRDIAPRMLQTPEQKLSRAASLLEALSFHKVLERGFAVIRDAENRPVTSASALQKGDLVEIQLGDGRRKGRIEP